MKKFLVLLCALPVLASAQQREFTLANYNSLRYSPTNIDERHPHFRLIMNDIRPDILVLEELYGQSSAVMFLDSVLNVDSTTYSLAPFVDGNDLDAALFYKTKKFTAANTSSYPTQLRDIAHFRLVPFGSYDTLHVFGVHLKASSGSANEARRKDEVMVLRNVTDQFSDSTNFVVCGDFNIYSATEPAYQDLLADAPANQGHFIDEFDLPGTWNNPAYAQYHTQSPRTTQFNGGAHGGMDDRFDMILYSQTLADSGKIDFVSGSLYVYGNDGQHYDKAITDAPVNTAVTPEIANALHLASDHLPVVARFSYDAYAISLAEPAAQGDVFISYSDNSVWLQNLENDPLEILVFALSGKLIKHFTTKTNHRLDLKSGFYIITVKDQRTGKPLLVEKVVR